MAEPLMEKKEMKGRYIEETIEGGLHLWNPAIKGGLLPSKFARQYRNKITSRLASIGNLGSLE